jgi:Xaa-Pro aminopeptidase
LWEQLAAHVRLPVLLLADPLHLRYLANFYVDPFSLGADFGALLAITPDGHATLYHDKRLPDSVQLAHVNAREIVPWYDGQHAGLGPRRSVLRPVVKAHGGRIHDSLVDDLGALVTNTIATLRRQKDADEIALLRRCMDLGAIGHAWARQHVRAGMTELDVYNGIVAACSAAAHKALIVYGDFAVSPGSARRGGPPTPHVLHEGDMLILDFSVVVQGYRSDFTNTLVVGGHPNAAQQAMFEACVAALAAGESALRAGNSCQAVYDAVHGIFAALGIAEEFPHHAGHGLGVSHPEAPFFVRHASETLVAGDVVTLEPGLYRDGVGGIRIEHNYLVTAEGYERLSHHTLTLT